MAAQENQADQASGISKRAKVVSGFIAGLAAIVVALNQIGGGISNALDYLVPDPTPIATPTPRPTALSATVSNVLVEQHMPLGDYLENDPELIEEYELSDQDLAWRGVVIAFHVEISGFLDRECTAKYSVFDHDDGGLVPEGHWLVDDVAGFGLVVFTPEAATDEANGEVWVPYPDAGGTYLTGPFNVRLAIHDDKDVEVSEYAWSGPISPVF
jgi:hypothetical protein